MSKIVAGLVLACLGDGAALTYKRCRQGNALIDRAAAYVLQRGAEEARIIDFVPWGWDERSSTRPGSIFRWVP